MQPGYPGGFTPPPYAPTPLPQPQSSFDRAKSQVTGPAIGLMVASGMSFVWWLFLVVMMLLMGGLGFLAGGSGSDPMAGLLGGVVAGAVYGFFGLAALVTFLGALRMKAMKSYGFAMTSCILAILPCTTYVCCFAMMPFGIWALVVLLKQEVKAEFH